MFGSGLMLLVLRPGRQAWEVDRRHSNTVANWHVVALAKVGPLPVDGSWEEKRWKSADYDADALLISHSDAIGRLRWDGQSQS